MLKGVIRLTKSACFFECTVDVNDHPKMQCTKENNKLLTTETAK